MTQQEEEKQAIEKALESKTSLLSGYKCVIRANDGYGYVAELIQEKLSDLRKPSENLVKEITRIIQSDCGVATCVACETEQYPALDYDYAEATAKEIAKLLPCFGIDLADQNTRDIEITQRVSIRSKIKENYTNSKFRIGGIVPYINSRSKVSYTKIKKFQIDVYGTDNADVWFHGIDIKTGAKTWYPLHKSIELSSRSQQTDVNAELLEALKSAESTIKKTLDWIPSGVEFDFHKKQYNRIVEAISNAEKQIR